MPEQVRFPYGDAFIVGTPHIDQLANRLYQQEQQERLYKRQQEKLMDDEFARNLSGIKDADIGDLTKAYGDYKLHYMRLQRRRGRVTPEEQLDLLRSKANVFDVIQKSKEEKAAIGILDKAVRGDKTGIYDDEKARNRIMTRLRTPTSQYGKYTEQDEKGNPVPFDLTDENAYLYKLGASDFGKDFKEAEGKERQLNPDEAIKDPNDPFRTLQKTYKGKNSFIDYYNTLLPRIAGSKEQKDFVLRTNLEYPPEKQHELDVRFNELLKDPNYRKRYGLKEGDNIPLSAYDSDLAKAVAIRAKQHAIDTRFTEGKAINPLNTYEKTKDAQQFAIEQQARGAKFAMDRVYAIAGLKRTTENEDDMKGISAILNNTKTIIDNGKPVKGQFGQEIPELVEVSDIDVLNTAKNIKDAPISKITFDKNKDQFNIEYDGWMDTQNNFHPAETIPLSKQDYLRIKVDKMNPKNKGNTNAILDKIISDNKGLYPAIQKAFAPEVPTQTHTKTTTSEFSKIPMGADVMIKVNGKVMKGKKSDLQKLDNAKIKYEIIK